MSFPPVHQAIQAAIASLNSALHPTLGQFWGEGLHSLLAVAIIFFVLAIVAYMLGAKGVAGMSASLGRTLLFVFLVIFIVLAIVSFIPH